MTRAFGDTRSVVHQPSHHRHRGYGNGYSSMTTMTMMIIWTIMVSMIMLQLQMHTIGVDGAATFAIPSSSTCVSPQRFDEASVSCVTCDRANTGVARDNACQCANGYKKNNDTVDEELFTCSACATNRVAWRDGSGCTTCDITVSYLDATTRKDCRCGTTTTDNLAAIVVEFDGAGTRLAQKTCRDCPTWGMALQTGINAYYECLLCPDTLMTASYASGVLVCTCPTGYTKTPYACVVSSGLPTTITQIMYQDTRSADTGGSTAKSVTSIWLRDYYLHAYGKCNQVRNREACQMLANMCVVTMYDPTTDSICSKFDALVASPVTVGTTCTTGDTPTACHTFTNWVQGFPWLKYADATDLTLTGVIQQSVTLFSVTAPTPDLHADVSNLIFRLAKYAANGTFIGFETLTSQLMLCGGSVADATRWQRFGTRFISSCEVDLTTLMSTELFFYELFLQDLNVYVNDIYDHTNYYPVPVKVLNYRDASGNLVNEDSDGEILSGNLQLRRRFFLVDTKSGVDSTSTTPIVVQYAKSITLRVTMVTSSENKIYPPVLAISYGQRYGTDITSGGSGSSSTCSFQVIYSKDNSTFWTTSIVFFVLGLVGMLIGWTMRVMEWNKFNTAPREITMTYVIRVLLMAGGVWAEIFLLIVFILAGYYFIIFKWQATAFMLLPLPDGREISSLKGMIVAAFVGKTIDIILIVWRQISADMFLTDWERPRGVVESHDYKDGAVGTESKTSVSVWRKLQVARHWRDLQVKRAHNLKLTLLIVLFFLYGLNLQYLANAQPQMSNLSADAAPIDPILRFAVSTFFLFIIAIIQLSFRSVFLYRFLSDPALQFVDLLSIANISLFVFDHEFHGYYIHGKTVHGHADASLEEMNEQLAHEQGNHLHQRGLRINQSETRDIFEIYVTDMFRQHYKLEYGDLVARHAMAEARTRGAVGARRRDAQAGTELRDRNGLLPDRNLLSKYASINHWLCAFIDQHLAAYPWRVEVHTFWEKTLGLPARFERNAPAGGTPATSLFFVDDHKSFRKTILMGIERDLLYWYILLFAVCDIAFGNTLASALVCWIGDELVSRARQHWGQINVAKKTLIPDRFFA